MCELLTLKIHLFRCPRVTKGQQAHLLSVPGNQGLHCGVHSLWLDNICESTPLPRRVLCMLNQICDYTEVCHQPRYECICLDMRAQDWIPSGQTRVLLLSLWSYLHICICICQWSCFQHSHSSLGYSRQQTIDFIPEHAMIWLPQYE